MYYAKRKWDGNMRHVNGSNANKEARQVKGHKQRTKTKLECKFKKKKNLKDTSVCVTHCDVSQLRTMRPLASLSLVSSWSRALRLSTSHSLPPLAKILPNTGAGARAWVAEN